MPRDPEISGELEVRRFRGLEMKREILRYFGHVGPGALEIQRGLEIQSLET